MTTGNLRLLGLALLLAFDMQAQDFAGTYLGELSTPSATLRLGLQLRQEAAGKLSGDMVSIDQAYAKIRLQDVAVEGRKLKFRAEGVMAGFEGEFSENGQLLSGKFVQGLVFDLTFRKVEALPKPARPQEPKEPFPYASEEVGFTSLDKAVQLAGTLSMPRTKGPFGAVVLVSGSGPQDRNESIAEHKPFLLLADHLTRTGMAVLRYDDRGTAKSSGVFRGATTQDFAQDAAGAVAYLRGRKDIDPKRIVVLGHSEGGLVAPIVASKDTQLAGIILLAGPGLTGEKILEQQLYDTLRAEKIPEAQFPYLRRNQIASIEKAKESDAWLKSFLVLDPAPVLAQVKCPVLALNGSLDTQVNADQNLAAISKALTAGGNQALTVKKLPTLNHLFQHAQSGAVSEYGKIEETMAPEAIAEITAWLKQRLAMR